MRRITSLILLMTLVAASASAQETRYITDILQLGLFSTRDGSGEPIRNLVSGTEVTVLERIPNFARVRTASGDEGWVKSAFLVAEKPAQLRMTEAEAEIESLRQELAAAQQARDAAFSDARSTVADAESLMAAAQAERETLVRLREENDAYARQIEHHQGDLPWQWVAAALAVALGAGFVAGYWWLDAAIRRRHGGFRVH